MRRHIFSVQVAAATLLLSWSAVSAMPGPPVADRVPVSTTLHGDTRVDDYAWLRNKLDPKVIAYLNAENEYTKAAMADTESLTGTLYEEMLGRIKQTDLSVPFRYGPYLYYSRTVEGLSYPIYCRKPDTENAQEQVLLNVNDLAEGHEFFNITSRALSPDHRYLAYATDTTGYETVSISIKNLETNETDVDVITEAAPWSIVWANDGETLFYGRTDETKRLNRIYRHTLGAAQAADVLVKREDDVQFGISVSRTLSDDFMLIGSGSSTTSEVWFVDARQPANPPQVIAPRKHGVRYSIDHHPGLDDDNGGTFYVTTDADDSPNFRVVTAPVSNPGPENWTTLIPHSLDVYITGVSVFQDHMAINERRGGYRSLRIRHFADGSEHVVELPETVAVVMGSTNAQFDTDLYRFMFTSMITPMTVFDYNVNTRDRTLLKQTEVLGGYNADDYETRRLWATATDGVRIPISIVHRKGVKTNGENPCLLYGYGSYGASMDPFFSSNNVSLLDRGFVYATAHIRGGAEMGRHWKEDGKMLHKRNTFTDFIACAEHLIEQGYTNPRRFAIRGGSAGGLLIGAVVNMRPDLFEAAHAAVPFVDVINTMLDPSIPLTTGEYEEWGNPNDEEYYKYIKSYSPYDNVTAQEYPHMLITAGLNDSRVHYWEPAKWAAKLRATKTDDHLLLIKTNMGAGHGGASGRYDRLKELAFQYAFIVDRVGAPSGEQEQSD